ncbi:Myb domain protein 4r1, partial [Tanacetum coccineum]
QCLARFQRSLNPSILNKEWTPTEDEELCKAVAEYGETNWQLVASVLSGRTGTQCSNRWKNSLNPLRARVGRWDSDEDKRLKIAVRLFGAKNWNKITKFVPGRTQVQCRERWVNCLDPSLKVDTWTEEEDMKLKAAVEEHNHSWARIAACIPPRTDSQCRRRWMVLLPHQVLVLKAAKEIEKRYNATANDVAVAYLKNKYANWEKSVLEGNGYICEICEAISSKVKLNLRNMQKLKNLRLSTKGLSFWRKSITMARPGFLDSSLIIVRINDLSDIFGVSSTTSPILSLPIGSLTASWFSFAINSVGPFLTDL